MSLRNIFYIADKFGCIKSCEAKLRLEDGVRDPKARLAAGGGDRLPGDHGGHLVAKIFGGSGGLDNLVAMDSKVNTSKFKTMENAWKKALNEGKTVEVKIDIRYENNSMRPKEFKVDYYINNEKSSFIIPNGGQ